MNVIEILKQRIEALNHIIEKEASDKKAYHEARLDETYYLLDCIERLINNRNNSEGN
jgi:hypothetical protein